MLRNHDKEFFYKYTSLDTAKHIITNQKLKWSCPSDFNDPFEHLYVFFPSTNMQAFNEKLIERFKESIFGDVDPLFDQSLPNGEDLAKLREMKDRIPRSAFDDYFDRMVLDFKQSATEALAHMNDSIDDMRARTRVLCLTEKNDNLLMWSHYADSHKGVVFKLNCVDEIDDNLLVAKRVKYKPDYPILASKNEWIDHLLHIKRLDFGERYLETKIIKNENWHYEQEWRLSIYDQQHEIKTPYYWQKNKKVFGAIYLGCEVSDQSVIDILSLVAQHLPDMEVWKTKKNKLSYKLDFERI